MQWQPGHYGLIPAGENTAREFVVMRTTDSGDALIRTLGDGEEIEFDMKQLHKIQGSSRQMGTGHQQVV